MPKRVLLAIIASSLLAAHASSAPPVWTSDKRLEGKLARPVTIEGLTIRPPKGYEIQRNGGEGASAYAWTGGYRPDGTQAQMMLCIAHPPPKEIAKSTLEQLTLQILGGTKRRRTAWQQGKVEVGVINGIKFGRVRWTGTEPDLGIKMQGFLYVAKTTTGIVFVSSQDILEEAPQTLRIAEAAALTLRRDKAPANHQ